MYMCVYTCVRKRERVRRGKRNEADIRETRRRIEGERKSGRRCAVWREAKRGGGGGGGKERDVGQGERRGERKERTTPSSSRVDSNAGDISTNQITPRAPPFIIILLVFPLLHPHWMTFSGPFRGAKKLPAPNRRLHDSSFGTLLVPTLVHGPPPLVARFRAEPRGLRRLSNAFPRISNSSLFLSLLHLASLGENAD